jgi:hypothetical protein
MKRADHHLVQQVLDGDVSREDFDRFQQRLREEPELVDLYGNYALLHHTLSEEFEGSRLTAPAAPEPRCRLFRLSLLAVACLIGMLALLAWWLQPWSRLEAVPDVAMVTFSVDATWSIEGGSRNLGGATGVARGCHLRLNHGRANIALQPSVTAWIEGPAEVVFLTSNEIHLARGRGKFHRSGSGDALTVTTPRLVAVDSGTRFGIEVGPDDRDELHVEQGGVRVTAKARNENALLATGDAVRVTSAGVMERFPSDGRKFATGLGRFRTVVTPPFDHADWRWDHGKPSVSNTRVEGANYSLFLRLPQPEPGEHDTVLLATLGVGKPVGGKFHTDGWAGMSFYSGGVEMLFFGDAFGSKSSWSLDVKRNTPLIVPEKPVVGPRAVTLRYDPRTGSVSLHDGGVPLRPPFCEGRIPAGTRFDEIRIGASAGAALTVNSLVIRVGGD